MADSDPAPATPAEPPTVPPHVVEPPAAEIVGVPAAAVAGAPAGSAGGAAPPANANEFAPLVPRKKYRIHKLINALFKLIGKKVLKWDKEKIEDELLLDENENELVDDAFEPLLGKMFKKLGLGDDYFEALVACILIFAPRIITIASEMKKIKKEDKAKGKSTDKPKAEREVSPPDDKSAKKEGEHTQTAGDASWTWKGAI